VGLFFDSSSRLLDIAFNCCNVVMLLISVVMV
jgi:hypothetical protein